MDVVVLFLTSFWVLAGFLSAQDVADCSWRPASESLQLNCNLKTLQTGPAVIPQVHNARSLGMKCSDIYLYESVLRPDHFGSLPSLRDLTIDFCKIRIVPSRAFIGLNGLESLKIQGHNSEWSGSMTMQVQTDTFKNLENLSVLDLADNNLWGLPAGSFCHTPNLKTLNLSRNNLVEVSEIGLAEVSKANGGCQLLHLKEIDLSFNQISSLQEDDLNLVPGLTSLNLRGNRVSVLSDNAFSTLWSLSSIDLSDNDLAALPPTIFQQSSHLQKLFLQNNSLSLISPNIFNGLENLLLLNLSRNSLSSHLLSHETFSSLSKLVALDLSHNGLTSLNTNLLSSLQSLQILNVQHNSIATITPSSFTSLLNLHILLLSHNHLETIPEASFSSLASLNSLSLDHNKISTLPPGLFASTAQLQDLAINNNYLQEVPSAISNLPGIRTLDLGENHISSITGQHLKPLINLYGLRLAGNKIEKIAEDVFSNNTNLHVLNIAHNKIHTIEQETFKSLNNLRALRLDNNQLKDINGLVSSQKNLRWLNVSANSLQWFDFAFIPKSLEWLDLHNNKVDKIGNYYSLSHGFNLRTFDASFNRIRFVQAKSLLSGLENIYLNNNNIKDVAPESFSSLRNLSRVELQGNELVNIELAALATAQTDTVPEFLLGGNPYLCDCTMEWLRSINQLSSRGGGYPRVMDLDSVMCSINGDSNSSLVPVLDMESSQFMCEYRAHCMPECLCCDFFACDCRMQCPEGCSCYHDNSWSSNVIQCSARGHEDVPALIPMDATTVYLDGNNMTDLVNQGFIGRRRIKAVYLNNSMITSVTNYSFDGLTEVSVLHLEDNQIEQLAGNEFEGLIRLKELYLQNNDLISIASETFSKLRSLTVLRLDGNLLTTFPIWELTSNPMLVGLYLAGNMWSCECNFLNPFMTYQRKLGSKIIDKGELRCIAEHFQGEAITQIDSVVCGENIIPDFQSGGSSGIDYTPILVSVLLAILMIVIGYLLAFTFRSSIKEWLYSKTSCTEGSKNNTMSSQSGKEKLFDVFMSYSIEDRDFVEQSFAPSLEHGATSYRLCLHQRDFPATAPVFDTVTVAVESSARVLIFLSRSYVVSQWSQIRVPIINSIKNNNTSVVFVQLEDISDEQVNINPDLKHLIEGSPIIRWGDQGFWNKLRYFLPEPVYLTFHRNVTMRGTLPSSNLYHPVAGQQQSSGIWSYSTGDSQSSEDTTTTEINPPKTSPQCDHMAYQSNSPPSIYSFLDHTYHTIDNNHIYHTLDPGSIPNLHIHPARPQTNMVPNNRVYINRNLDLVEKHPVLQITSIPEVRQGLKKNSNGTNSLQQPSVNHIHTHSTSSAKRLISPEDSEYIV